MKEKLSKLVIEWDQSLHMAGNSYWKIVGITDPKIFFENLPTIFPYGMTLLVEGLELGLTSKSFYEEHPAQYVRKVARDTFSPVPDFYHVAFSEIFAEGVCQIIKSQGLERAFYHIKGYSETEILFTFHDAFENELAELAISKSIEEATVRKFADALGSTVQSAEIPVDHLENLRALNRIFNPLWWLRILRNFGIMKPRILGSKKKEQT